MKFFAQFVEYSSMGTDLTDILKQYRKDHGFNQAEMADFLGIGYRTYQEIEKTGSVAKLSVYNSILQKVNGTDAQKIADDSESLSSPLIAAEPDAEYNYVRKRMLQKMAQPENGLISVPIAAQAGYSSNYQDPVFIGQLQRVILPGLPYNGQKYRVFEVNGESMEPTFKEGYHVVAEYVEQDMWPFIANYYVYVVVTETQVLLKRLFKLDDNRLVLISDNEAYFPQQVIHLSQVKELWLVKRKIDWEMAPPKMFDIKVN